MCESMLHLTFQQIKFKKQSYSSPRYRKVIAAYCASAQFNTADSPSESFARNDHIQPDHQTWRCSVWKSTIYIIYISTTSFSAKLSAWLNCMIYIRSSFDKEVDDVYRCLIFLNTFLQLLTTVSFCSQIRLQVRMGSPVPGAREVSSSLMDKTREKATIASSIRSSCMRQTPSAKKGTDGPTLQNSSPPKN